MLIYTLMHRIYITSNYHRYKKISLIYVKLFIFLSLPQSSGMCCFFLNDSNNNRQCEKLDPLIDVNHLIGERACEHLPLSISQITINEWFAKIDSHTDQLILYVYNSENLFSYFSRNNFFPTHICSIFLLRCNHEMK